MHVCMFATPHTATGTTAQGLVDLLDLLNRRAQLFAEAAAAGATAGAGAEQQQQDTTAAAANNNNGRDQQQQGVVLFDDLKPPSRQQLLCLKLGPPAGHQQQQQCCGGVNAVATANTVGWPSAVFDAALDQLQLDQPLMQQLQVLELHGLSSQQQAQVCVWC